MNSTNIDAPVNDESTKIWVIIGLNVILLLERLAQNFKYINCTWKGCQLRQHSPANSENSPPIRRRSESHEEP